MSTVPITGVGNVIINPEEATSNKILDEYMKWMKDIQEIFDRGPPFTAADYAKLQAAEAGLTQLALEGDKTSLGGPYYMPKDMLQKLDTIFALLKGAHLIGPDAPTDPAEAIKNMNVLYNWKGKLDGKDVDFQIYLAGAVGELSGANKSLQSMLYTEFVIGCNDQYEKRLSDLEGQLELTKDIMDNLGNIQDWWNKYVTVPASPGFNDGNQAFPIIGDPTVADMKKLNEYRKKLIADLDKMDPNPPGTLRKTEGTLANNLSKVIEDLNFLTEWDNSAIPDNAAEMDMSKLPPDNATVNDYYNWAIGQGLIPSGGSPEEVLMRKVQAVQLGYKAQTDWLKKAGIPYTDQNDAVEKIKKARADSKDEWQFYLWSAKNWMMDNRDTQSTTGEHQDNINKAITSGNALNDKQKEELRSIQYDYDQFMKIAGNVMATLTKTIEKMAEGISR